MPDETKPKLWTGGTIKDTRANVLSKIAASGLPDTHKAVLAEAVGKVREEFNLIRLDYNRHDHGGGENGGWTVMPA